MLFLNVDGSGCCFATGAGVGGEFVGFRSPRATRKPTCVKASLDRTLPRTAERTPFAVSPHDQADAFTLEQQIALGGVGRSLPLADTRERDPAHAERQLARLARARMVRALITAHEQERAQPEGEHERDQGAVL